MIAETIELARVHAPLLAIVAPLLGAALALCSPAPKLGWALALVASAIGAAAAIDLAVRVLALGRAQPIVVEGIALAPDGVGVFAAALLGVCGVLSVLAAGAGFADAPPRVAPYAMALAALAIAGWSGAAFAADLPLVLLASETAWLACVGLAALSCDRHRSALNGALRMLIAGGVGSAFTVAGLALIWRSSGDLGVAALAFEARSPLGEGVGLGLALAGLIVKTGAAPFGFWAGAAFSRMGVLAALSVGVVGVGGALLLIVRLSAHAFAMPEIGGGLSAALALVGAAAIVAGSVQAMGARNLRRLACYAGAAQAGGVLVCVALGSPASVAAALVQIMALVAAMLALYAAAAAGNVDSLDAIDGFARRAPLASVAVTFGAVSLIGAPLTIGFLGRWRLIEAAVGVGWWWAVGAMTFASLAAVLYAGRLIERTYFRHMRVTPAAQTEAWRLMLAPALIASIAMVSLGLAPASLLEAAAAAASLTGNAP